ncbi:MAG: hypothetical protein AB7I19_07315 [Planctomycetota bacterium]
MKHISLLGLLALSSAPVAQDLARVVLKDGTAITGTLRRDSAHAIELSGAAGESIYVPRGRVRALFRGGELMDTFTPSFVGEPEESEETHLRWVGTSGKDDGGLETKTSRWWHAPSSTTVLLVGVVHIGDPTYFQHLQRILDSCDLVLFEGVGRSEMSDSDLASLDVMMRMQLAMRGALGLGFQSDHVDYARDFWVNSDVDFAQLRAQLDERRAQLPTDHPMMKRILGTVLRAAGDSAVHRSRVLQYRAKLLLGPSLSQADTIMQQPAFAGMRGAIIEHRNEVVMRDLERELTNGTHGRRIAVFYGAGHMPDFVRRFLAIGLEHQESRWQRAWDIPAVTPRERLSRSRFDEHLANATAAQPSIESVAIRIGSPLDGEWYSARAAESAAEANGIAVMVESLGRTIDPRAPQALSNEERERLVGLLATAAGDRAAALEAIADTSSDREPLATAGRTRASLPRRDGASLAALAGLLDGIRRRELRGYSTAMHEELELVLTLAGVLGSAASGTTLDGSDGRTLDLGVRDTTPDRFVVWAMSVQFRGDTSEADRIKACVALRDRMLAHVLDALR